MAESETGYYGSHDVTPPERESWDAELDDDGFGDLECTHCGGEGLCWDGSDPLGNCPDDPHRCHACHGTGKRRDQTIW